MKVAIVLCCLNVLSFYMPDSLFEKQRNQSGSKSLVVESTDKVKLEKLIKERNGKVLLLNLWATWCIPCREEFPDLVKIKNSFPDVDIVGISNDYKDEIETKIKPFLKKQNVNFTNYVNGFDNGTDLIDFLNKNWNGALPATFIFDSHGNLKVFAPGKKDFNYFQRELFKLTKN